MTFTLLNLETSELVTRAQFADGATAARVARLLTKKTGRKYQPRKAPESTGDIPWQSREVLRFITGEYVKVIDDLLLLAPGEHYPHVAKKSPDLIAYTKDALKGAADKQSVLSIAAYVELVGANCTPETKARLIEEQRAHAFSHCSPFKLAKTEDEIEHVYTNFLKGDSAVAASCMRFPASRYDGRVDGRPYHPVRVYAAGDLAIAYIANASGETIARALVWPERKLYSRLYCGEDSTLAKLLKAQGYKGAGYYDGRDDMSGAKLLRVESDNGDLIVPYLDEVGTVEDCGDSLRIGGEYSAQSTRGTISLSPRFTCENCDEECDEHETRTVYTNSIMSRSEQWCECCADNRAIWCYGDEEYFDADRVGWSEMNGDCYTIRWLEMNASLCEHDDEWCTSTTTVIVDVDGNTEEWGENAISRDAFKYDGDFYSDSLDYEIVIVARHVPFYRNSWRKTTWTRHHDSYHTRGLVFFADEMTRIPTHIIDAAREDGRPICFEASDGKFYATDYVDHYPLDRPRKIPALENQTILDGIAE